MKELLYTVLELEKWNARSTCFFCYGSNNKAICQIRTRNSITHKIVANDCACENCKEKFENDELPKCESCGRLQDKSRVFIGKCRCVEHKENTKEKELPVLPSEERQTTFYERQINGLREELNTAEVEIDTHLEALEVAEDWHKKQKQELVDRIKKLEADNERLKELTPQELLDEISKLKEKVKQLEEQNNQLTSQIEVKETKKWPWRLKK